LIAATGLQFTMINLRPSWHQTEIKMYSYIQSEELLKKMQHNSIQENKYAADINNTADQIKGLIIEAMTGKPSISKNFEDENILIQEGNLGNEFRENGKGKMLFAHLKEAVNQYNSSVANEENKIPSDHFHDETINLYSNFVVLNYVVQLQMYVATNENKLTAYN
jgi:hypothetical protein